MTLGCRILETLAIGHFALSNISTVMRSIKLRTDESDIRNLIQLYLKHELEFQPNLTDRLDVKMDLTFRNYNE